MTHIAINEDKLNLRVWGHSGYAEAGQDIICAGVSALVRTWERCVGILLRNGILEDAIAEVDKGSANITVFPAEGYRHTVEVSFNTICTGLQMLYEQLGQYISLEYVHG